MHTRASNSERVEALPEHPRIATDRVVASTPGSAITIPEIANEFAIKGNIIKIFYHGLSEITQEVLNAAAGGNSNTDTDKIMARMDAMTIKMDAQYKELQSRAKQPTLDLDDDDRPILVDKQSGRPSRSIPSNTQPNPGGSKAYQQPQDRNEHVNAVFTRSGKSYNPPDNPDDQQNNSENPINFDSDDEDDEPAPQPKTQPKKLVKETPFPKPYKPKISYPQRLRKEKIEAQYGKFLDMIRAKQLNLRVGTERMIFNIDSAMKHSYSNDNTCFSIDEILEEDFDALLDEGSKIFHSIEETLLEKEIFSEFDEFIAMAADENSKSESDTEESPFEKITINTYYKIQTSLEEPPTNLELKPLPDNLEYVFLEEPSFLLVIIPSQLSAQNKSKLVSVLKNHKEAFAWKMIDIHGICPSFCKDTIQLLDDKKPVVQKQRRLNPNMQEVVKKEIMKLLDTGIIYPIVDSPWVSPIDA
ncbi:hypothetical protein Tco_0285398 [Tanacetum coccineum]